MERNFTAALIAGGKSTRMGRDKASVELEGLPLWLRQLETLRALNPTEILISGRTEGAYAASGIDIIPDAVTQAGPLAGLTALLQRMRTPLLLVLAVDMPAMTAGWLARLVSSCGAETGAVPERAGFYEGLAAVFPKAALPLAEAALRSPDRSLQQFVRNCVALKLVEVVRVAESDAPLFHSANFPSDLPIL